MLGNTRREYLKRTGTASIGVAMLAGCTGEENGNEDTGVDDSGDNDIGDDTDGGTNGDTDEEENEPVNLKMSSFATGTGWYVLGGAVADNVVDYLPEGSSIDVQTTGGGIGVVELLKGGDVDFGIGYPGPAKWGYNGEELDVFDEPFEDLRALIGHLDTYWIGIGMRDDLVPEDIQSFSDVREQEFGLDLALAPAGGSGPTGVKHSFQGNDITFEDLNSWGGSDNRMDFGDMPSAIQGGDVHAISHVASPGHPTWTEVGESVDLRFLEQTDKGKEYAAEKGWIDVGPIPEGMFGSSREVEAMGSRSNLLTTADLPDYVARAIVKGVYEEVNAIQDAYAAMEVFDPEKAGQEKFLGVPIHPGAEDYMQEQGYL